MATQRYKWKQYFTNELSEENEIEFIYSRHCVIFFLLYKEKYEVSEVKEIVARKRDWNDVIGILTDCIENTPIL